MAHHVRLLATRQDRHQRTEALADALDRLASAVAALTQHVEHQDRILARCESHLAQEGRWTASAVTALTLAATIAGAPPVQSHRASRVVRSRVAPPADAPAIGLLAQLSSDASRLAGDVSDDEASTEAVALTLRTDLRFAVLRTRMSLHAPPVTACAHTSMADCLPMLRWLAEDARYARITTGVATVVELLAEYDAASDAAQDGAS